MKTGVSMFIRKTKTLRAAESDLVAVARSDRQKSLKSKLILSIIFLSLLAVGLNTFFTETTLEKLYIELNISQYQVFSNAILRKIENGLSLGKNLEGFTGIEKLISNEKTNLLLTINTDKPAIGQHSFKLYGDDISIAVADLKGLITYSDPASLVGTALPGPVLDHYQGKPSSGSIARSGFTRFNGSYYIHHSVCGSSGDQVGTLVFCLNEKVINRFASSMIKNNIAVILSISIASIIALIAVLSGIPLRSGAFSKRNISIFIFFIICSSQLLSAGILTYRFKDALFEINKLNCEELNRMLQKDIEYLIKHGLPVNRLLRLERILYRIIQDTSEIDDITVYDQNRYPLYRATRTESIDFQRANNAYSQWIEATKSQNENEFNSRTTITKNGTPQCYISTNSSQSIIFDKIFNIALKSLTALVISILFLVELLILFFRYMEREPMEDQHAHSKGFVHYSVMRPAAFLLLFGVDISISFIPLHMKDIYSPLLGLPKETIIGLPISVEFMFVGIAILISGVWLDRRGWHEPFLVGLGLAGLGFVYSGFAPGEIHFIVSRAIVGLGYGLSLMASQGFVINFSDSSQKARGLANLFAGIYAGSICGGATGGMLSERVGYQLTFLIGALILFAVIAYTLVFMKSAMKYKVIQTLPTPTRPDRSHKGFRNVLRFLTNRIVVSLIFFSSLPAAIATVGFLNYFMPLYLNRLGMAQSTIGQVLMIYGIFLIYIGPFISKYIDISRDKKKYVFFGCLLGSVAFLSFYFVDGMLSAIVSIMLLGLSSCFVLASQSVYALKLKVTRRLGEGAAIGIFRSTSRVGQMLGPIIFSWMFAATNINQGIFFFGIFYLSTAFLFILLTRSDYLNLTAEEI
jgi:predicted MFS family arabinose efflux permease